MNQKVYNIDKQIDEKKQLAVMANRAGDKMKAQQLLGQISALEKQRKQFQNYGTLLNNQINNIERTKINEELDDILRETNKTLNQVS